MENRAAGDRKATREAGYKRGSVSVFAQVI
jgi:hypothetical protein